MNLIHYLPIKPVREEQKKNTRFFYKKNKIREKKDKGSQTMSIAKPRRKRSRIKTRTSEISLQSPKKKALTTRNEILFYGDSLT